MSLDFLDTPHRVLSGPADVGTEQRWIIERPDGTRALVAQLAADLARDPSIRRRWVRDLERVMRLPDTVVLPTLAHGPQPDPRAPDAAAPWRLRASPDATTVESVLARAPIGLEEFTALFSRLADTLHSAHRHGAVLRDLKPGQVLLLPSGEVVLCDIGLARVDVLSSHTASSLMLQGSPYAAPEQLYSTTVDQRSDLFSLGALMWHALTGALPYDGGALLLRDHDPLPDLRTLRPDTPTALATIVRLMLDPDPAGRPSSASEVAWVLRGGAALALPEETVTCQHCGAALRVGQRLCIRCGRLGVQYHHCPAERQGWGLDLRSLREDAAPLKWLQENLRDLSQQPMRLPEFLIGNVHMYDEEERSGRIRLPARLYSNLEQDTALALYERMHAQGLDVRLVSPTASRRAAAEAALGGVLMVAMFYGIAAISGPAVWGSALAVFIGIGIWLLTRFSNRQMERRTLGQFRLREAPVALPASDPLVARLAALLDPSPPEDVREVVARLALLLQRLVDHRATLHGAQVSELEVVTAPATALVDAVERAVATLRSLSDELSTLDEGAMVRALAASEARDEPPSARMPILEGLDRLRSLEDQRAAVFHRLLEAQALLHRSVELGLAVQDPAAQHERDVQRALATLGPD